MTISDSNKALNHVNLLQDEKDAFVDLLKKEGYGIVKYSKGVVSEVRVDRPMDNFNAILVKWNQRSGHK